MIHSITELYKVQGTSALITKEASEIIKRPTYKAQYKTHPKDAVTVYDVDGTKTIYMFGEKTWFDTQEELNEYRAAYQKEQEAKRERNKVKNAIIAELDKMSIEQLKTTLEDIVGVV